MGLCSVPVSGSLGDVSYNYSFLHFSLLLFLRYNRASYCPVHLPGVPHFPYSSNVGILVKANDMGILESLSMLYPMISEGVIFYIPRYLSNGGGLFYMTIYPFSRPT